MAAKVIMLAVGDLILGTPKVDSVFSSVSSVLKSADVVVGQGEIVFTKRGMATYVQSGLSDSPVPACDPIAIKSIRSAGFNVVTLAGNHIWDWGVPGVEDTISGFRSNGIITAGAGMNIDEARSPGLIECSGIRLGFLSYNCVGPHETWANSNKPGCAYVQAITHYELDHPTPGGPPTIYTFAEPCSYRAMLNDVRKLRSQCDILTVSFHKGIGFIRSKIATFEQDISYGAIDAGADLILSHHTHMLKGVEVYKGKMIFHGLGDFVWATDNEVRERPAAMVKQQEKRMKDLFGIVCHKDRPGVPNQPEAKQTIIAKCYIENGQISRVSYLPCLLDAQGLPIILKHSDKGRQVFDYVDQITREAELNTRFEWDGDEVVILSQ
jgi:hypothetical protein